MFELNPLWGIPVYVRTIAGPVRHGEVYWMKENEVIVLYRYSTNDVADMGALKELTMTKFKNHLVEKFNAKIVSKESR